MMSLRTTRLISKIVSTLLPALWIGQVLAQDDPEAIPVTVTTVITSSVAPVARFDCEMLDLQRERQVAEVERANINLVTLSRESERLETLRADTVVSEMQLERTQADRDLAGSDLRIANIAIKETDSQLSRCSVLAPFSGVITQRLRRAGEDVERSTILAAMTDTQNLEVRASVPAGRRAASRSGRSVGER